ncbi:MAG: serine/threonine protein kinase [Chitinispirillaceae bacterium]|nr:serine/threonine protein kinase [Chitinispirillaceae bacterium]
MGDNESKTDTESIIELALERKLITANQLDQSKELLRKSKKIGFEATLEEVIVNQGFMLAEQFEELRHISQLGTGDGTQFGTYKLGRLIGEGGMGKVYEAVHEFMGRTVAVKVINQEHTADKTKALRFFQEIRALIKLDHPNIVTVYDAGRVHRNYYYAMELLPGPSLLEYANPKKPLPEKEALAIIRQMARALSHAHANKVVHRDVKPENIIFDRHGVPKLTDFGIAMHHDQHHLTLTTEGVTVGSLHYTSPEQVNGSRDIDARADIYSLGATLYYALTGRTVYSGGSPQELLTQHLSGTMVSPRKYNSSVSKRTVKLIKKMMAVKREKRFPSMKAVIAAIDRPSFMYKFGLVVSVILGAAVLLMLGMLVQKFLALMP